MRYFSIFLAALLAACSGEQAATDVSGAEDAESSTTSGVKLYAMDCGRIDLLDLGVFASGGEYDGRQHSAAVMCFMVSHPDGDLVWDAGLPDALNAQEDGVTNPPFHLAVPNTMASQLEEIGVSPADIEYFTASHSHFDHVGNAGMFAGSTFLVDANEREYMFRDEARADEESFPLVAPLEESETKTFDGDLDVFGDGSVIILDMPGHTPGHKSLLVNLDNAGPVLLTGDLYHLIESRERRIVPAFNFDEAQTRASMDRFEEIAAEKGARVIIQHSLEHMASLPMAPEYLD